MKKLILPIGLILSIIFTINQIQISQEIGPNDPSCFELSTCDIFSKPLESIVIPYAATFGDFTLVIIWGIIIGILWLRVQNTMMVGIVGIALAAVFLPGFSQEAQVIGYGLLAVAVGVAVYQMVSTRLSYPIN